MFGLRCLVVCLFVACASPKRPQEASPVRLLTPLEFTNFTVHTNFTKAVVATLMREKVKVGSEDSDAYLFLALPASPSASSNPAQTPVPPLAASASGPKRLSNTLWR